MEIKFHEEANPHTMAVDRLSVTVLADDSEPEAAQDAPAVRVPLTLDDYLKTLPALVAALEDAEMGEEIAIRVTDGGPDVAMILNADSFLCPREDEEDKRVDAEARLLANLFAAAFEYAGELVGEDGEFSLGRGIDGLDDDAVIGLTITASEYRALALAVAQARGEVAHV